jgi:hypothetical protein
VIQQIPDQVLAIDWSGALSPAAQRRGIRAATCSLPTGNLQLLPGALRTEIEALLLAHAANRTPIVAGLDFSFSYPAWFLREAGCNSAPELWAHVAQHGEHWLREPHPHFWGRRKGSGPPATHRAPHWLGYRQCELAAATSKRLPLSSFQIGGAGAVGTGTLRGMPMLARLRAAGFSIWPFDPPALPLLVEIYPRLLTGPVIKSSPSARTAYLRQPQFAHIPTHARHQAEASEDAFDALVSALIMRRHAAAFALLPHPLDETTRLEGAIWNPASTLENYAIPHRR